MSRQILLALALVGASIAIPAASALVTTDAPAKVRSMSTDYSITCIVRVVNTVGCSGGGAYLESATNVLDVAAAWGGMCVLYLNRNVNCETAPGYGTRADRSAGDALAVSGSPVHRCILLTSRHVDCDGSAAIDGQAADWFGGDAIKVSTAERHTCILRASRNVDCYGYNGDGRATDYNGGDAVAIDATDRNTCVVRANGQVLCYGAANGTAAPSYTGSDAIGVGVGRNGLVCVLQRAGNVRCIGTGFLGTSAVFPPYLGGDAVAVDAGLTHYCVLTRGGNVLCPGFDTNGGNLAQSVWYDPTLSTSDNIRICDDWNGDGTCTSDETILVAPGQVTINGPTGVALMPDGDDDGVARGVSVGSGTTTIDLAHQSIRQSSTSSTVVAIDPDDNDPNDPGRVRLGSVDVDVGCANDHVCVGARIVAGAAGSDLSRSPSVPVDLGAPADAAHGATGHRPYGVEGNDIVVHGAPTELACGTDPMALPVPIESVAVGGASASFGCSAPGSVTTPSLALSGAVVTAVPGQTRAEPGPVASARCAALDAFDGTRVAVSDVHVGGG